MFFLCNASKIHWRFFSILSTRWNHSISFQMSLGVKIFFLTCKLAQYGITKLTNIAFLFSDFANYGTCENLEVRFLVIIIYKHVHFTWRMFVQNLNPRNKSRTSDRFLIWANGEILINPFYYIVSKRNIESGVFDVELTVISPLPLEIGERKSTTLSSSLQ